MNAGVLRASPQQARGYRLSFGDPAAGQRLQGLRQGDRPIHSLSHSDSRSYSGRSRYTNAIAFESAECRGGESVGAALLGAVLALAP